MKSKDIRLRADADMVALLGSSSGRRLFVRLLTQSGLYSPSYADSHSATSYNEGRRGFALALLEEAKRVAPDRYAVAMQEHFIDSLVPIESDVDVEEV